MGQWERGTPFEPQVGYLPRQGEPESRPLRALRPGHPLMRMLDQVVQPVLPAGEGDVTR